MESSKLFYRCLREASSGHRSCVCSSSSHLARRSTRNSTYILRSPQARAFSGSTCRSEDGNNSRVPRPSNRSTGPNDINSKRRPRLDLSSLTSNPNYEAPKRTPNPPTPSKDAINKALDNLFKTTGRDSSGSPGASKPTYNSDFYRKDGAMARTSRFDPSNSSSSGSNGRSLQSQLLRDIIPRRSNSAEASALANLKEEREMGVSLRLKPTLGRSVNVNPARGMDLTRAFQTMEAKVNQRGNSIRQDERKQKFHVRRGQAKKLDKSRRWRLMFKEGYLKECERVRKMIKQGW